MNHLLTAALIGAAILGARTAQAASGGFYVQFGPPQPYYEPRGFAPGPGYVWIPGCYDWQHSAYRWRRGYWTRPPHPHAVWAPGRWVRQPRGWAFTGGHWSGGGRNWDRGYRGRDWYDGRGSNKYKRFKGDKRRGWRR
jgi:hypothetical protein